MFPVLRGFLIAYDIGDAVFRMSHEYPPPPLDDSPDFPLTCFTRDGVPHFSNFEGAESTIVQIVPCTSNPYVRRHCDTDCRPWAKPAAVLRQFENWLSLDFPVVLHPDRPEVRVLGVGRGRSRFLCGAGISIFIIQEGGVFPTGSEYGGVSLDGYVAVLGVAVPSTKHSPTIWYLLPLRYLSDPVLPGLPVGLTPYELLTYLPPAPVFSLGPPVLYNTGYYRAMVSYDVSERELAEGGGSMLGLSVRGQSYLLSHVPVSE